MKNKITLFLLSYMSVILPAQSEPQLSGYFIDAPVTGLYYETSSGHQGFTDKGRFEYDEGDAVKFYLGQDNRGALISAISGQEIVTPNNISTQLSRSINLTRLLMSLDSTPNNRNNITIDDSVRSNTELINTLNNLDLSYLDSHLDEFQLAFVSIEEAARHLKKSHEYIKDRFASEHKVLDAKDTVFIYETVKKRDYKGSICAINLDQLRNPYYHAPIGKTTFEIKDDKIIEYPSIGDRFEGCQLVPNNVQKVVVSPLNEFGGERGLVSCANQGCRQYQLNGFYIDDRQDGSDWKYRSIAINYDEKTHLLMEKSQGLGKKKHVDHNNVAAGVSFIYPKNKESFIDYSGVWIKKTFNGRETSSQCVLMKGDRILEGPKETDHCPITESSYQLMDKFLYRDAWWLNETGKTTLSALNVTVSWFDIDKGDQYTSWEYLPVNESWLGGTIYQYNQIKILDKHGLPSLKTINTSMYTKYDE